MTERPKEKAVPERSQKQRTQALKQANEIRYARAELKRQLKQGEVDIRSIIADPPPYLHTAKILELILAHPGIGPVKAQRLLSACRISPSRSLVGLTPRQCSELAGWLSSRAPGQN